MASNFSIAVMKKLREVADTMGYYITRTEIGKYAVYDKDDDEMLGLAHNQRELHNWLKRARQSGKGYDIAKAKMDRYLSDHKYWIWVKQRDRLNYPTGAVTR